MGAENLLRIGPTGRIKTLIARSYSLSIWKEAKRGIIPIQI
jgi:hypothetical protein